MLKTKTVASIEAGKGLWKLVIGSPSLNYNQIVIEHVGMYSNIGRLGEDLNRFNISNIIYSFTNQYTCSFVSKAIDADKTNLEAIETSLGLEGQQYDYFNFSSTSLLVSIPNENIREITGLHVTLKQKGNFIVSQTDLCSIYSAVRSYPRQTSNLYVALLHVTESYITLSLMQFGDLKQIIWDKIIDDSTQNTSEAIDEIIANKALKMLIEVTSTTNANSINSTTKVSFEDNPTTSIPTVDVLYLTGEINNNLVTGIKAFSARKINIHEIVFLDPLLSNLFSLENLPVKQQEHLEENLCRYGTTLSALSMAAEGIGIDLSLKHEFAKRIPEFAEIKIQSDFIAKVMAATASYSKNIVPAIANQKLILILGLVISSIILAYRFQDTNNKISSLEANYLFELQQEQSLAVEKREYQTLQARNKTKNERIAAIRSIQKNQMLVPTILGDVQDLAYQQQFRELVIVSKLKINGADVTLSGNSIDKINAVQFVSKLQGRNYEDVIPTRYTSVDAIRCTYELTTRRTGEIPMNPVTLPLPSEVKFSGSNQVNQPNQLAQTQKIEGK